MRDELLKFFGPQEERLKILGEELVVRTLSDDTPVEVFQGEDVFWRIVVASTFKADGTTPVFTNDDIETVLKPAKRVRILPLVLAVQRVNAMDIEAEVKNSDAGPSSG